MREIPVTSVSLIKAIAADAQSVRWTEFYRTYERPMRGFLASRYPSLEADDILQETMLALMKSLPGYRYVPDVAGHFHNYLMGIVKHKAMDALAKRSSESARTERLAADPTVNVPPDSDESAWRRSMFEVALQQLLADESVSARNREVFRAVAVLHQKPDAVAADFGIKRNLVDQIKNRMIAKLTDLVKALTI